MCGCSWTVSPKVARESEGRPRLYAEELCIRSGGDLLRRGLNSVVVPLASNPSIGDDHPGLLCGLHFVNDDYERCVQDVMQSLYEASSVNLEAVAITSRA